MTRALGFTSAFLYLALFHVSYICKAAERGARESKVPQGLKVQGAS